jgi:hypothetical protein
MECYVERTHMQYVDVAILRIASKENSCLESHVHFLGSGMDEIGHHEVLRGPSLEIVQAFPRLLLHSGNNMASSLAAVHTICGCVA